MIVPVYRVEPYLRTCVDSILNQSFSEFELILVDDGSPDDCPGICDEYAGKDARVRVIHKENGGLSDARNAGLDVAIGEYVAFVDSDDFLRPDMLLRLHEALRAQDGDVAMCDFQYVDEAGKDLDERREPPLMDGVWDWKEFWKGTYGGFYTCGVVAWNKLYRRSLFQQVRYPVGKWNEDEFALHPVMDGVRRVVCVGEKLYCYRQRQSSIMSGFSVRRFDAVEAKLLRTAYFLEAGEQRLAELALLSCVVGFDVTCRRLDVRAEENRERYGELLSLYRRTFFRVAKGGSIGFFLRGLAFAVGPRFYRLLRGGAKQ